MNFFKGRLKKSKIILVILLILLLSSTLYPISESAIVSNAHSGRTDSAGGHKDNKNKSGLGSYHYHCGGNPPHLHDGGVCPYGNNNSVPSETTKSNNEKASITLPKADTITIKSAPSEMKVGQVSNPEYILTTENETSSLSIKSSNESVVSVGVDGSLKATGVGTATITVKSSDKSKQFTVIVKAIPVESIVFSEENTRLQLGELKKLYITVLPENATNKTIEIISDNENAVICKPDHNIEAVGVGSATITVRSSNNLESSMQVEVYEVFPEEVKTNEEEIKIELTKTDNLQVDILPTKANNKEYSFKVKNDEILKIEDNGDITPLMPGNTIITIETHNNINKDIPVEVYYIKTDEILIKNESDYSGFLDVSDVLNFNVEVLPANATYKEYQIVSSNDKVISVANNKCEIVGSGKVTLTFEGHDEVFKQISFTIINKNMIISTITFLFILIAAPIVILIYLKRKKSSNKKA